MSLSTQPSHALPNIESETPHLRTIRSFVLRQGRLTKAQQQAMEQLWTKFGLAHYPNDGLLDFADIFGRIAPVTLEIGFGNGESLADMAATDLGRDFIGIEVHTPGVGHLLQRIQSLQLSNLRLMNDDAVEILHQRIPNASLDRVQIYFPDPWHKKRHHKRRIIQPEFVQLLVERLKPNGALHLATDWQEYAEYMAAVLDANPDLQRQDPVSAFVPRPDFRPLTKFEQRGLRLGHGVWDLLYGKISPVI